MPCASRFGSLAAPGAERSDAAPGATPLRVVEQVGDLGGRVTGARLPSYEARHEAQVVEFVCKRFHSEGGTTPVAEAKDYQNDPTRCDNFYRATHVEACLPPADLVGTYANVARVLLRDPCMQHDGPRVERDRARPWLQAVPRVSVTVRARSAKSPQRDGAHRQRHHQPTAGRHRPAAWRRDHTLRAVVYDFVSRLPWVPQPRQHARAGDLRPAADRPCPRWLASSPATCPARSPGRCGSATSPRLT